MLTILVVLAVVLSCTNGLSCTSNMDCMLANAGCCRVDGVVVPGHTDPVRGVCGAYIQEGEPCATGFPVAYMGDCRCETGLVCFPDRGSYTTGTCRTQQYVDDHGGFPVMPIGK
ncbi:hypothetical protein Bbelb_258500 [Branchiostoma belcheri]|nr:hypothetical protein Bbelb_258500 [Branchiostoma belcheri]